MAGRTRAAEDLVDGGKLLASLGAGCRRLGEGQQRLVQDHEAAGHALACNPRRTNVSTTAYAVWYSA